MRIVELDAYLTIVSARLSTLIEIYVELITLFTLVSVSMRRTCLERSSWTPAAHVSTQRVKCGGIVEAHHINTQLKIMFEDNVVVVGDWRIILDGDVRYFDLSRFALNNQIDIVRLFGRPDVGKIMHDLQERVTITHHPLDRVFMRVELLDLLLMHALASQYERDDTLRILADNVVENARHLMLGRDSSLITPYDCAEEMTIKIEAASRLHKASEMALAEAKKIQALTRGVTDPSLLGELITPLGIAVKPAPPFPKWAVWATLKASRRKQQVVREVREELASTLRVLKYENDIRSTDLRLLLAMQFVRDSRACTSCA